MKNLGYIIALIGVLFGVIGWALIATTRWNDPDFIASGGREVWWIFTTGGLVCIGVVASAFGPDE